MRLNDADQQTLLSHARLLRYGAGEIVQCAGEVPVEMMFVVTGLVRLTATADDGSVVPITTLEEGGFLGLTALTRQPNLSNAYAIDEVTTVEIGREHVEHLVMRQPLLLQDFGHILEERQSQVRQSLHREWFN